MKNSKYLLLMAAMIMAAQLSACGKPADAAEDSSTVETTAMAAESTAEETTTAVPETEAAMVTHTIGIISIDLPEDFSVEDVSQSIQGIDAKMLMCTNPGQRQSILISYYDTGEDDSETYDVESGLQGGLDSMLADAKAQVGSASIQSETETQQVEFAGRTWGHRNAVVIAGREKMNLDVYATAEMKQGFASIALINMDGSNEEFTNHLDSIITINEQ